MKLYKNYFIVGMIYLVTILGVLYISSLYNKVNSLNYDSTIDMFILESSYDKMYSNISNFSYENDTFAVFYSLNKVPAELKNFMIDYDVTHSFLYLDNYDYLQKILNDYSYTYTTSKEKSYFIYFSSGKIINVIECSNYDYNDYVNYFKEVGLI